MKALPIRRRQFGAFGATPKGLLAVFHLLRISNVFASFPEPVLVRFLTESSDSNSSPPDSETLPVALLPGYRLLLYGAWCLWDPAFTLELSDFA